jgi:hypothetical protein
VGSSWVLYLGFNWATYVYPLVYLEAHDVFFYIYNVTYQKKRGPNLNLGKFLHVMVREIP